MSQRFSDAELACEFWFAHAEFSAGTDGYKVEWFGGDTTFTRNDEIRAEKQVETIKRFATLPHAHDPEPRTIYAYLDGRCIGSFPEPTPAKQRPRYEIPNED